MSYTARLKVFCDDKRLLNMVTYRYINQRRSINIADKLDTNYCTKVYDCYKGEIVVFQLIVNGSVIANVKTPALLNREFNKSTYKIPATTAVTQPIQRKVVKPIKVKNELEIELDNLKGTAIYICQNILNHDAHLRQIYIQQVGIMSERYLNLVKNGELTVSQAAKEANQLRNTIMEIIRKELTSFGRNLSEKEKLTTKTFDQFLEYYAMEIKDPKLFKQLKDAKKINNYVKTSVLKGAPYFNSLNLDQRNRVYYTIIQKSGTTNKKAVFNSAVKFMRPLGRVLVIFTAAFAGYEIYYAENREKEAYRQGISIGTGIAGGAMGGALGGAICGPGSPICSGIGILVGGAIAGYGTFKLLETFDDELEAFTTWHVF